MPRLPRAPSTIELRYSQIEDLIAWQLDVHSDRRKTLGARMRLFRTRGFPSDVIAITKTQFAYDLDAVLQMTLAYSMMDAFIPQETAPVIIERDWKRLKAAFAKAFALIEKTGDDMAAVDSERPLLLIHPRNLHAFSRGADDKPDPGSAVTLKVETASAVSDRILEGGGAEEIAGVVMIDLLRLAAWVRKAILEAGWAGPDAFNDFGAD